VPRSKFSAAEGVGTAKNNGRARFRESPFVFVPFTRRGEEKHVTGRYFTSVMRGRKRGLDQKKRGDLKT